MNMDISVGGVNQNSIVDSANSSSSKVNDQQKDTASQQERRIYPSFTKDQLDDLVSEANKLLSPDLTEMHYVLHDKLNKYYVQVIDMRTKQVVREIPPKKFMDMYAAIAEKLGLIINKRV